LSKPQAKPASKAQYVDEEDDCDDNSKNKSHFLKCTSISLRQLLPAEMESAQTNNGTPYCCLRTVNAGKIKDSSLTAWEINTFGGGPVSGTLPTGASTAFSIADHMAVKDVSSIDSVLHSGNAHRNRSE